MSRLLRRNGRQFEHAAVLRRFGNVAATKGKAHGVELAHVVRREIGRPSGIVLISSTGTSAAYLALVDELDAFRVIVLPVA